MLRRYRGLQNQGYGVKGNAVAYEPFKLVLSFREVPEESKSDQSPSPITPKGTGMILVISATPVGSLYRGKYRDTRNQRPILPKVNYRPY